MSDNSPILFWFRRDLRLADHEGLTAAVATGRPVIPVFIHDEVVETHGAAPKWRLGLAVAHHAKVLERLGARLILRRGNALTCLLNLIEETGAGAVWWSRAYDPAAIARDTMVKARLGDLGVEANSFKGHVLFEPWTVKTKTGGFYRVYSPMWKELRQRELEAELPAVKFLRPPDIWPASDLLEEWDMGRGMRRGSKIVAKYVCVGETSARERLARFIEDKIADYDCQRDYMAAEATSRLSENLTYGEISPRTCWFAGWSAMHQGMRGAEHFLRELVWREFAYHLVFHTPHILDRNWRDKWDGFAWNADDASPEVRAWLRGRTGVELVDAAMREMYVTGTMQNRGRMIVASYLTKHLLTHWKIGMAWFGDCLIDWDPASNAMGWQWVAGCGPDAAPYFRVFNPDTQAEKFDKNAVYRATYLAEPYANAGVQALEYFDAIPKSWKMAPGDTYPDPIVALDWGRKRALEAYAKL